MRTDLFAGWPRRLLLAMMIGVVATLVLSWFAGVHPIIESTTNVRAQLIVVALVPLAGFVGLRRWPLAGVAACVLVWTMWAMVPYWTASPDPIAADTDTFHVMQFNIYFGNRDFDAIVAQIDEADASVVVLQELLPEQWRQLEPRLAQYPHQIAAPLAEEVGQAGGGMAILSRSPLTELRVPADISPIDRVVLAATTEVDGTEVTVIGLHPHASRSESAKVELRDRQLEAIAAIAQAVDGPMMIVADLNLAPTSPKYQEFVQELGWRDPHRVVGWQASWPSWAGAFGLPIDHVLVSNDFALHGYEVRDGAGSDHRSVVAQLSLIGD